MDKRYQVFVSSTYEDLQEERKEVMQALLELDCIPAGMELFPASNADQWTLIKKIIDDCDYYLLILGGRYGSTNSDGMGYTEMEYRYALETHKPVISFLHKNPGQITAEKSEKETEGREKLKAFRDLVQTKMTKYWTSPADLGSVVSRSMIKLIKDYPAIGWVKADNIVDETSFKEILKLQKENEELKNLLEANKTQAPKGTEDLEKGEDLFKVILICTWYDQYGKEYISNFYCNVSWNIIFKILSPHLINRSRESYMKHIIAENLKYFIQDDISMLHKERNFSRISSIDIDDSVFQIIKVQFIALGYIENENNKSDSWFLTEHGKYVMTQLVARRK